MNFFIPVLFFFVSCTHNKKDERILTTAHFKFYYTEPDDKNIREIADSLEAGYIKITAHLQSGDLPVVNVHFYKNAEELQSVFPGIPSWAVGQATSVSEIHMVSPNNPKQDYANMVRNVKHEFAHCVSMQINPTISNNPRWLWESVAIYEANFPWDPKLLTYLVNQKPPSLTELNNISNPAIYEVGHFIGQFIVETHGAATLKFLIQNNGNLEKLLQIDAEEFTKQWFAFVKKKYGI